VLSGSDQNKVLKYLQEIAGMDKAALLKDTEEAVSKNGKRLISRKS